MESCHLQDTILSNKFEPISNSLHSYLFLFNKYLHVLIDKYHCFKINKVFSNCFFKQSEHSSMTKRIIGTSSVLSQGYYDLQKGKTFVHIPSILVSSSLSFRIVSSASAEESCTTHQIPREFGVLDAVSIF